MIRRLLCVCALLAVAITGSAQESPVRAAIDWAVSDAPGQVVIAGWAFNCATAGQQPFSARVFYSDGATASLATVARRYSGVRRDDVAAAFGDCGDLNRFTGYHVVATGIPSGFHTITIEWADSFGVRYVSAGVTVQ